jgi:hypothetical protein
MGKKSGTGSGMNNPDNISGSSETLFWVKILKLLMRIRGSGINIPDPQHGVYQFNARVGSRFVADWGGG